MLYHAFQLCNNICVLKNIALVPVSEMLISLDKFNNILLGGADNKDPLGFLEAADDKEEGKEGEDDDDEGEEGEGDDEDDEDE
jgi:ABC-type Zn2+ transport system substrate-binding protein/surface adhesin